jgi:hypothetical protein
MKDFTQYPEAFELKELGFDEPCLKWYSSMGKILDSGKSNQPPLNYACSAPTYSQAFRWFRENHNCHHTINLNKKYVGIAYSSVVNFSIDEFNTYEEAELECLKKLIELVKTHEGGKK